MNVEPFLVASSLIMLCAQRLCRKICRECKKPIDIPKDLLEKAGFAPYLYKEGSKEKVVLYTAEGCKYCNNTGFYGRIAILEAVMIDDNIREMVIKNKSLDDIKKYAMENRGMRTLRDDGYLKVKEELTTLDEAIRITTEE